MKGFGVRGFWGRGFLRLVALGTLAVTLGIGPMRAQTSRDCAPPSRECAVPNGHYMALPPPGWDGRTALPALMHFHGFRETAADMLAREDVKAFAARAGLLLVVPQGAGQTWSHPGSPAQNRDEFAFVDAVLADVKRRWPVDGRRLWASGFSQGASMLWNLACDDGQRFAAYLTISGAFWRPEPSTCPGFPVPVRHIHGLKDRTVPLEGRPIRGGAFHQGDVMRAIGMMRAANACAPMASRAVRRGALVCEVAGNCTRGKSLEFCLHDGGHDFDPSWLENAWEWVQSLP